MLYWVQHFMKILLEFDNILLLLLSKEHREEQAGAPRDLRVPARRITPTRQVESSDWPRHRQSFRSSFSSGSTRIFASTYAFFSIFQDLQENHLLASKFAKICEFSRKISRKFWKFSENLQKFY